MKWIVTNKDHLILEKEILGVFHQMDVMMHKCSSYSSSSKFCPGHNFNTIKRQDLKLGPKIVDIKERSTTLKFFTMT